MNKFAVAAGLAAALMLGTSAMATDLEVTHWWTSGGEAAAVAEFAKAFDATGNHWVDGAIAGSSDVARPIIISRILGGNPMGATQLNTGRDADELIAAGLMTDLTEIAEKEGWRDIIQPRALASCDKDGKIYCVPVNIHSNLWMWLNRHVYEDNGIAVPTTWKEFIATAPQVRAKGIIPLSLANGWPVSTLLNDIAISQTGIANYLKVYKDKDADFARGPEWRAVFEAMDQTRQLVDPSEMVPQWNDASGQVISGKAAANVMGDWAQGEFAVANQVAGKDYDCLPGLGAFPVVDIGGDSFFFPVNKDPAITAAQLQLASLLVSPAAQVSFNLKKGSMPIRSDIDLATANDCMKKGLAILANPDEVVPSGDQLLTQDITTQIQDLYNEFFTNHDITVDEVQGRFADIIATAD